MKIYEVIPRFKGTSHVVVARNANEAIEITAEYLNQCNTCLRLKRLIFTSALLMPTSFWCQRLLFRRGEQ